MKIRLHSITSTLMIITCMIIGSQQNTSAQTLSKSKLYTYQFRYPRTIIADISAPYLSSSLSFMRSITNGKKAKWGYQAGGSYHHDMDGSKGVGLPVGINYTYGIGKIWTHIEAGIGSSLIYAIESKNVFVTSDAKLGLRIQPPNSRLMCRVLFAPVLDYQNKLGYFEDKNWALIPNSTISIGYNF